ncbi:2-hydroxyhepta-2,4-diene-1,7-dioate isomerase [Niabella ginsenosidivorans]|uniref:2-hydroxyhepta-2,4-diene-1,7-dioate isomerase n=1 Tax=Niabella ginsenosidivorans TaxID=1176587 RepID=A0A1A9I1P2_9BACT|nr:fumarylacetoacetate hydrolase family protein [Niabella ginsenosidivorans]ANH81546.1 2-hydroxyhepta-2,4-diene-1,7-dioate isomerase [Niabella ginsenosidivorans]
MKIICVGRNYAAHARELGNEVPEEPVIFMKPKSALLRPHLPFYYPEFTNELHYECELVMRVSKNGRYINRRYASQYFDAITLGIDFTARDIQNELKKKGLPWEKAKAFDNSAIIGKWRPLSDFENTKNINFGLYKNDELVQHGNSAKMIHSFESILAHVSKYFTVNIGDLIFTGTPEGVGEVLPGDVLEGILEDESVFQLTVE